jgi:hypothetical protein
VVCIRYVPHLQTILKMLFLEKTTFEPDKAQMDIGL